MKQVEQGYDRRRQQVRDHTIESAGATPSKRWADVQPMDAEGGAAISVEGIGGIRLL